LHGYGFIGGETVEVEKIENIEDHSASAFLRPRTSPGPDEYKAWFLKDVTIADGEVLAPNTPFCKKWLLRNEGTQAWLNLILRAVDMKQNTTGCVWAVGMVPPTEPGQDCTVSVDLRSPAYSGNFRVYWRLETKDGFQFGPTIWVDITVTDGSNDAEEVSNLSRADLEKEVLRLRGLLKETPK